MISTISFCVFNKNVTIFIYILITHQETVYILVIIIFIYQIFSCIIWWVNIDYINLTKI